MMTLDGVANAARGGRESPRRRNMHGAMMMSSRANALPLALKARGRSEKVRSVTGRARRAGVARAAQDDLTPEVDGKVR